MRGVGNGRRKTRKVLKRYYPGDVPESLVEVLYPVVDRVGYDVLEHIVNVCTHLDGNSERTVLNLLRSCPGLIDKLLLNGDSDMVMQVYTLCGEVARYNEGTAIMLLEQSPALVDRVGYDGLERIARLSSRIADIDGFVAARLMSLSPALVDRVGYDGLERIAQLCTRVGRDRQFIAALLEMTPELLDKLGLDVLEKVAELCGRVVEYSNKTAIRLLGESPELISRNDYTLLEKVVNLCNRIAMRDGFVAARVLEMSPGIIDSMGYDGLKQLAELCGAINEDDNFIAVKVLDETRDIIAKLHSDKDLVSAVYNLCGRIAREYNWRTAVRLLEMSPSLTEQLLRYGDKAYVLKVYALAEAVGEDSWLTAVGLLEESPNIIGRGGYSGLEKVAHKAMEIARAEGSEKATSFVRGECSEYADFFDSITEGLELKRIRPVLVHYLNALLGYRIEIVGTEGTTGTDGARIFLPERIKEFEDEDKNFTLYKVLATHEEAHLEYGSFDFELMRIRDVVGEHEGDLNAFYSLFPEPALAEDLMTILEDYRINSRLKAEYPVLGMQISEMNAHLVARRPSLHELANDKQRVVELIAQQLIAGTTKERVPVAMERILERAISISSVLAAPGADVHETARVTTTLYSLIDEAYREPYRHADYFSPPLDQSEVEKNIGNFGRSARKIAEKLNAGMDDEDKGGNNSNTHSEESIRELLVALYKEKGIKPREVETQVDSLDVNMLKDYLSDLETIITDENALTAGRDTYLYPEWGIDIRDYRPDWVRVREETLEGESDSFYHETIRKYSGQIKVIRREFQQLRPEGRVKLRGQFDGDDIDLDAAVQYFIDKRLKLSLSERNYLRTENRSRDIAVAFLVDMSGSTSGTTIACEKEALILMSEALKELGDAFAIYGFSGYGRDNVVFYVIKDFEEAYEGVQHRISAIRSNRSTRIAPAIRHTASKLRSREERTKIIILLSDGKPLDRDYYGSYAIEDTRMALKEAQRYGIKSFCITVDRESAEYLPRMYADSRWVVIDDVSKLPDKITRIYRRFTT